MRRHRLIVAALLLASGASCGNGHDDSTGTGSGGAVTAVASAGDAQSSTVGAVLATPLTVQVSNSSGTAASGVSVSWSVTSGGGSVSPASSVTDQSGRATTLFTLGSTVGTQGVDATIAGVSTPVHFTATAIAPTPPAGVPAHLTLSSGSGQSTSTGTAAANPLAVAVTDSAGNPLSGVAVGWVATANGSVSAASTTTDTHGIATVGFTGGANVGPASVTATVAALPIVIFPLTVTARPVNAIVSAGDGQTLTVGTALALPLTVTVTTSSGQAAAGVTVTWNVTAGGGVVSSPTSVTNSSGIATTTLTLGPTIGTQGVDAIVTGAPATLHFTATAIAVPARSGVPAHLIGFDGFVQTVPPSAPAPLPVTVEVTDSAGTPVSGVPVSWGITLGKGTLSTTLSITDAHGMASANFTGTTTHGVAHASAFVTGLPQINAVLAVNGPTTAVQLFAGNGQTGTVSLPLTVPLTVAALDAAGASATGGQVNWTVTSGGGTINPATSVADLSGDARAVFTLGPQPGAQTVVATAPGGGSPITFVATAISTTPTGKPLLIASIVPPGGTSIAHDSYERDGLAFLCAWNQGLVIYDVGNGRNGGSPQSPKFVSQVITGTDGQPGGPSAHNVWWFHNPVSHENRYAFVGQEGPLTIGSSSSGAIHIVDVSDLDHPVEVGFIHMPGAGTHNFWMDESNQTLYAAYYNGGVVKIDVSGTLSGDMSSRIVAHNLIGGPNNTYTWGVMLANGTLYASDVLSGFWALDPVTLAVKGGGNNVPARLSTDLWVSGNVGYTGTYSGQGTTPQLTGNVVNIWSLAANGVPTLADSVVITNAGDISDLGVTPDGRALVVTVEAGTTSVSGIYVYGLQNPLKPVLQGFFSTSVGEHTGQITVINGRTYVFTGRDPNQVQFDIFDITDLIP